MDALRFRITAGMVDDFAKLTGDRSSLHVDEAFARRAPFRRRVVHGMLPVLYLSQCILGRPTALSVRFLKPVFPGDELEVNCTSEEVPGSESDNRDHHSFSFAITRQASGETVTTGTVLLEDAPSGPGEISVNSATEIDSVVPGPLEERVAVFEDLTKGEMKTFPVSVTSMHQATLYAILERGLQEKSATSGSLPDVTWLYAACTSTYVGMCMPGRYATYTELTSTWVTPSEEAGEGVRFAGRVAFLSASTQMAVAKFSVERPDGTSMGQGTIKARVGEPPQKMLSMHEVQTRSMVLGLKDRVVLVTGASRGIGETIAKLFATHGARVVVNYYRGEVDAERVVDEIVEAGGEAIPVGADVTDAAAVDRLITEAEQAFGSVEVLVNNAVSDYASTEFAHLTWDKIQRDLDVILKGAFICSQAVLPAMVEAGFGRIVNLSTVAVEAPSPGYVSYIAAKSALVGLTRSLSVEYAASGITVNAVMPGMVETDLTANISNLARETVRRGIPMQRHATPIDVAQAVVYLASDWAAYTTGQQLAVTGGLPPFC